MTKQDIVNIITTSLDAHFEDKDRDKHNMGVRKAIEEEKRKALFIVLEPTTIENPDLHGDVYTSEEVEKACDNFNRNCNQANIQHIENTDQIEILESYITPVEFVLDTGQIVQKGTWLSNFYFPETEEGDLLWQGVKNGTFTGLSVGCTATTEDI